MPENKNLSGEFVIDNNASKETPKEAPKEAVVNSHGHEHSKASFLSSLGVYPENVRFENQEVDEEIVLLIRRDLITNVPWILTTLVLILIPFLVAAFADLFSPFFNISTNTQLILLLFYYLTVFGFVLVQFSLWYFTVGLVTNKRIIDLDLHGILTKHVSETRINLIEDVSYTQVGSIRSLFDYGDVHLQTAGTLTNFEFDRAPDPARIVRIIAELIGRKYK